MSTERQKADVIVKGFKKRRAATLQWNFLIPVVILALLVITAIFADVLAPYDPLETSLIQRLVPPAFANGGSEAHF
jgi:ABC-type antimicrobial peptide transport system permease subunit